MKQGDLLQIIRESMALDESLIRRKINEGWRGCDNIEMEYYNDWADPSLVYNGYKFNYYDIEDALWNDFLEDTGYTDDMSEDPKVEQEFNSYVQNYVEDYLEDLIYDGYFEGDSHDWRDSYNESFKRRLKEEVNESVSRKQSRRMNESASGAWSDALWDAVDEEFLDAKDLCFSFIKYLSEDEVEDFCRYNDLVDLVDEEDDYDDIDESCSKKSKVGSKKNNEKMNEVMSYHDSLVDIVTKAYTECSDSYKEQMYKKVLETKPDADPEDYSMFTDLDSIELEKILLPLLEESVLPEAEVPALVLYRIYNAIASQSWGDSYEEGWVRGYSRASDEASR